MSEEALSEELAGRGLVLHKKPGGHGYMIASMYGNRVVAGYDHGQEYSLTLEDAEAWLRGLPAS